MSRAPLCLVAWMAAACAPARWVAPLRYTDAPPPSADAPFRSEAPAVVAVHEAPEPAPRETVLPNGVRVVLIERHDVPLLSIHLVVRRSSIDVDDAAGVRVGQMSFLFGRAGSMAALKQLSIAAAESGFTVRAAQTSDSQTWVGRGSAASLDPACEALERWSFGAQLTPDEYEARRRLWQQIVHNPHHLGRLAPERYVLFGDHHPDGYVEPGPTILSLDETTALRASLLRPDRTTLLVVGDVMPEQLDAVASRWFGSLPASAPVAEKPLAPVPDFLGARVVFIPSAGLVQEYATVIAQGPLATPDDEAALDVLGHLLGGQATELNDEVRDDLGVFNVPPMEVQYQRSATWTVIGGKYDRDKVVDALIADLEAIARIRAGQIDEGELQRAREMALAQWRARQATVDGVASVYATAIGLGEDLQRLRGLPERLRRVGRADVQRAANRYLDADRLHVVFLGVAPGREVQRLGLGRVERLTPPK